MAQTATIKIVLRRGTLATWQAANPVLLNGEVGYVTDGGFFVIGDGVSTFSQLSPTQLNTTSGNRYRSEQYIVQNLLTPLQTNLQTQINNESNARTNGDATLTQGLNSEIQARTFADSNLQGQINAEITARTTADNTLASTIANVDATLSASIATLETNVQTWYGLATNVGDMLVFDGFTFQVLPIGINGQQLQVSTASPLGLAWQTPTGGGNMSTAVYDPDLDGIVESAEREQIAVINKTGATLTKGTIVYLKTTSASAQYPEVLKASATSEATSSKTIGAVYEDIANDATGYIVTSGQVHNLDTSAYTVGTKLWLSTTAGEVTTTPPTQPNHTVFIGIVTRSQQNNGRVLYAIQNGYELNELHDVLITGTPQDGDVLTYNNGLWIRNTIENILGFFPADNVAMQQALSGKEPTITGGTTADYWRGDKTWQPLNKSAVGLGNVDNTSDANKPVSIPVASALSGKEDVIQPLNPPLTDYFWRSDKTWQQIAPDVIGLANVDNTSDLDKPISNATQIAITQLEKNAIAFAIALG